MGKWVIKIGVFYPFINAGILVKKVFLLLIFLVLYTFSSRIILRKWVDFWINVPVMYVIG